MNSLTRFQSAINQKQVRASGSAECVQVADTARSRGTSECIAAANAHLNFPHGKAALTPTAAAANYHKRRAIKIIDFSASRCVFRAEHFSEVRCHRAQLPTIPQIVRASRGSFHCLDSNDGIFNAGFCNRSSRLVTRSRSVSLIDRAQRERTLAFLASRKPTCITR